MVIGQRVALLQDRVRCGHATRLVLTTSADMMKLKVKCDIESSPGVVGCFAKQHMATFLDLLEGLVAKCLVNDHGHTSSTGHSRVELFFAKQPEDTEQAKSTQQDQEEVKKQEEREDTAPQQPGRGDVHEPQGKPQAGDAAPAQAEEEEEGTQATEHDFADRRRDSGGTAIFQPGVGSNTVADGQGSDCVTNARQMATDDRCNLEADGQGSDCVTNARQMATEAPDDRSIPDDADGSHADYSSSGDDEDAVEWNEDMANQLVEATAATDAISARIVSNRNAIEELRQAPAAGWTRAGTQPRLQILRLESEQTALHARLEAAVQLMVDLESTRDAAASAAGQSSQQSLDPSDGDG